MICNECGTENKDDALFCANCGAELRRHHNGHQHHLDQQVQQKHQKKKDRRMDAKLKWHPGFVAIVLLAGVFVFIMRMDLFVKKQPAPLAQFVETRSADAKLEAKVMEIASKFICSCGTCGEKPLDTCTCNRAVEERQFIRNYLEQGQKPELVILALNNSYGWMKPQFASLVGDTVVPKAAPKIGTPTTRPIGGVLVEKPTALSANNTTLATDADRLEIFSHFNCPCGQCGVDELKDCGCKHPRGATEVKGFVDAKIAEGKYTVDQLMSFVEQEYGGRKF